MFMLDTGAVSASVGSIGDLASQFESLSSQLEGMDVSSEDGFDFESAKAVISANIAACGTKISNVSTVINNAISAHTSLQGSLQFGGEESTNTSGSKTSQSSSGSHSSSSSGSYSSSSSGGHSSSSGGNYSYSNSGTSYTPSGGSTTISTPVTSTPVTPSDIGVNNIVDNIQNNPSEIIAGAGGSTTAVSLVPTSDVAQKIVMSSIGSIASVSGISGIAETLKFYDGKVVQLNGNDLWYAVQGCTTKWDTRDDTRAIARKYGLSQLPDGAYETEEGLYIPGCSFKLAPLMVSSEEIVGLPAKGSISVVMADSTEAKPTLWEHGYSMYTKRKYEGYTGINEIYGQKVSEMTFDNTTFANRIEYNETGYATIEGRYVISCDDYFGRVGDRVQIFTDSGPIECVIGSTTKEDNYKLAFLTNDDFDSLKLNDVVTMTTIKSINNLEYVEEGSWKQEYGYSAEGHSSFLNESVGDSTNG